MPDVLTQVQVRFLLHEVAIVARMTTAKSASFLIVSYLRYKGSKFVFSFMLVQAAVIGCGGSRGGGSVDIRFTVSFSRFAILCSDRVALSGKYRTGGRGSLDVAGAVEILFT